MPGLQDNTIVQNSTTSNQGSNKIPKFNAKSHFFLEDEVFTQTVAKAFGVINNNEFRTTSLINVTNKKIISICSGQVFIQPQTGAASDKVNLVLKPFEQPIDGVSIKYFIYRGLPKDAFLDANNKILTSGSGFITYIRNEFNNFYAQDTVSPAPDFLGKFIGYPDANAPINEAQLLTDLIDTYFYKISQTFEEETGPITNSKHAFEMPMIPAGTHLATANGEIGLDIVLNYGDYYIENDTNPFKLNLEFARGSEYILNPAAFTDPYQNKLLREAATQFIDPAAYYGLHANGGSIYKFGQTAAIKTPASIYNLIAAFATKNNIYIYVQSERQRSYNFYGNYKISDTNPKNIKIGTTEANLVEDNFETNGWPVKVFSTTPANGSTQQTIALQFTTDKNTDTCLFGALANIVSGNQENFVDTKYLIQEPDANGVIADFTKTIILGSQIANNLNVASIIQLVYLGKNIVLSKPGIDDGGSSPEPILFTTKYMDEGFFLTEAISFLVAEGIYNVHCYKQILYNQQQINNGRNWVVSFTQRTANNVKINEIENLTLFTYLSVVNNERSNHSNFMPDPSSNKEATGYSGQNVTEQYSLPNLPSNEYLELLSITDTTEIISMLTIKAHDGSLPSTLVLGITKSQNDILKMLISAGDFYKIYFEPLLGEENVLIAPEGISFQKFKLGIIKDTLNFSHEIIFPSDNDNIIVYTIDGLVFYSKLYSENVKQLNNTDFVEFEINIKS